MKQILILSKRTHKVWKLELYEDEARVVRMMFNLCAGSGYGRCKIANIISAQGSGLSGVYHIQKTGRYSPAPEFATTQTRNPRPAKGLGFLLA